MLSMLFLLNACGFVEKNEAQTTQSNEATIQESVQQKQQEVIASETAENITENKEIVVQGVPLDRTSESTVYSDVTRLLKERYDLLNELSCEWVSTVDSKDTISVNLPGGNETVMDRVKVADSWEYYEEKARMIYDDGKLYRTEADGFVWGIDETSVKIWKQQGGNRYVVSGKEQNEMTSDVIFIVRKAENKDNKYEIIDEIKLYQE